MAEPVRGGSPAAEALTDLRRLARFMGMATRYTDGLDREVVVGPETLMRVCTALGAPIERVADAAGVLAAAQYERAGRALPPVLVAWDGRLDALPAAGLGRGSARVELDLDEGETLSVELPTASTPFPEPIPFGYHRLQVETDAGAAACTVIAAPQRSWQPPDRGRGWGVSAHLAALRSDRSRSVGDLADLQMLCDWIGSRGGDLVSVLPLLPTFDEPPIEPSPYSPVSRLFWSELVLDLGTARGPVAVDDLLSVEAADAEVRAALADAARPDPDGIDDELARYARFRAAQRRLGRDWRRWPATQRGGDLGPDDIDSDEERFQLAAQVEVRRQLADLRHHLDATGVRLGLDLAVGVHPLGYDVWSRPDLFADAMSVGAPPDAGFPSGQSWGFAPVLPHRSSREGHAYLRAGIAHQAALAGVLRVDHVMAMHRLYWIPDGMGVADGTYVHYPTEELFAVLCLESHRNECQLVGENLGTVPAAIDDALPLHGIPGMYLAEFEANGGGGIEPPTATEVAMIDTHDTPTLAGWLAGSDIDERVTVGLLDRADVPRERGARRKAVRALAEELGGAVDDAEDLLSRLIEWLGRSAGPLVVLWLEDLWLETRPVNVPGSTSAQRPNWQRAMARSLDEALTDPAVNARLERLEAARRSPPP